MRGAFNDYYVVDYYIEVRAMTSCRGLRLAPVTKPTSSRALTCASLVSSASRVAS